MTTVPSITRPSGAPIRLGALDTEPSPERPLLDAMPSQPNPLESVRAFVRAAHQAGEPGVSTATDTPVVSATVTALPEFELPSPELLYAEAYTHPETGERFVSLNSQRCGQLFTPAQTLAYMDQIEAFTAAVRAMATQIPLGRAAAIGAQFAARVAAEVPTLAEKISPEALADIMTGALMKLGIVSVTAADRGPKWMTRYGCPPWCAMDHQAENGETGWHRGPRAEAWAPRPYADAMPGDAAAMPLSATMVHHNEGPEIFGTKTEIWVDTDVQTLELTPAEGRAFAASLRRFAGMLDALSDQAEEFGKDDRPENPEAVARWFAEADAKRDAERAEILKAGAEVAR
ncbi:DUF6907 domain-containing protein [Streptomyces sp. NPDC004838]